MVSVFPGALDNLSTSHTTGETFTAAMFNDATSAIDAIEAALLGGTVPTVRGTLTNRSGTITTGGTQQTLAASNSSRNYLLIQNPSTNVAALWINFGTNAVQSQPSIEMQPGLTLTWEGSFVPTDSVSIIGPTTAVPFVAKEG